MRAPNKFNVCLAVLGFAVGVASADASAGCHLSGSVLLKKNPRATRLKSARRSPAGYCRYCQRVRYSNYRMSHLVLGASGAKRHAHYRSKAYREPVVSAHVQDIDQDCKYGCAGATGATASQTVESVSVDAALERARTEGSGGASASDGVVIAVEEKASSVEQIVAFNVAIADQTDGAARLMLASAAGPARASMSGWNAPVPGAADAVVMKYRWE